MKGLEDTSSSRWHQVFICLCALTCTLIIWFALLESGIGAYGTKLELPSATIYSTGKQNSVSNSAKPLEKSNQVGSYTDNKDPSLEDVRTKELVTAKEPLDKHESEAQENKTMNKANKETDVSAQDKADGQNSVLEKEASLNTTTTVEVIEGNNSGQPGNTTRTPEQGKAFVPIKHVSAEYTAKPPLSDDEVQAILTSEKKAAAVPLADDAKQRAMVWPRDYPTPSDPEYMQKCGYYHASEETTIRHEDFDTAEDDPWQITPRSNHAMVSLVSGDQYARLAVSLVAGLRKASTCAGIDIIMLLSAGGMGSDECNNNKGYTDKAGVVHECGSLSPVHPSQIISTVYINALQKMGVRFQFTPRIEAPKSTLKQTHWWGLAFNKVNVFGMHQYEKVILFDTDTMVLRNMDHLTFYPMFTASTNQGCCAAQEGTHISGGLWVVEPSKAFYHIVKVLVNGTDPRLKYVPNKPPWVMTDLDTVNPLFTKFIPRTPRFPGSSDSRQAPKGIKGMYTEAKRLRNSKLWNEDYLDNLNLTSRNDITTMPLHRDNEYSFRASTHDRNEADVVADKLQLPEHRGYVWHALNASYDFQARECIPTCAGNRDRGVDHYFSVHFSCLPGHMQKPSRYSSYQELVQEINNPTPNVENTTCLLAYYEIWRQLYADAMGEDLNKTWSNPAYNATAKIAKIQLEVDKLNRVNEKIFAEKEEYKERNEKEFIRQKSQFKEQIAKAAKHKNMSSTNEKAMKKRTRRSDLDGSEVLWAWLESED